MYTKKFETELHRMLMRTLTTSSHSCGLQGMNWLDCTAKISLLINTVIAYSYTQGLAEIFLLPVSVPSHGTAWPYFAILIQNGEKVREIEKEYHSLPISLSDIHDG